MNCSIIAFGGKTTHKKARKTLYLALCKYGFSVSLLEGEGNIINSMSDFIIVPIETTSELFCDNLIYVPLDIAYENSIKINENACGWLILKENLADTIKTIPIKNYNIITCGFGIRDTIAVASSIEDGFSISVQRTIKTINNKTIAPGEIKIYTAEESNINLFIGAVLIICGVENPKLD